MKHLACRAAVATAAVLALGVAAPTARADDPAPPVPAVAPDCSPTDESTLRLADCSGIEPVPDLDPADTPDVIEAAAAAGTAAAALPHFCRYSAEAVFYAATDWIRLTRLLSQNTGQCNDYFISVPPVTNRKTDPRKLEADKIRAFGPHFHPMAEINYAAWQKWVADNPGQTYYGAGVRAGSTAVAADFDYETWALNEVPSSVRQGPGAARTNLADFVRGLHDGSGVTGLVWTVGLGQRTASLDVYRTNLGNWLLDSSFWEAVGDSVRFWAQEAYGDVRAWAVPGASRNDRTTHAADYLLHPLDLAEQLGDGAAAARAVLERTYTPFGNSGTWNWTSGFGWTAVDLPLMESYASEQVYAVRHFEGAHPQTGPQGRWGAAYQPQAPIDVAGTEALLTRIASALHEAYEEGGGTQMGACGPAGDRTWCDGELDGSAFVEGWGSFGSPPFVRP